MRWFNSANKIHYYVEDARGAWSVVPADTEKDVEFEVADRLPDFVLPLKIVRVATKHECNLAYHGKES